MNRRRPLAALALTVLFLASIRPAWSLPRKEEWIELKTANFTLYSNAGRTNTERIGTNLERLRAALKLLTPDLSLSSPYPTSIFIFKSASALEPYQRIYNGKPQKSGGYFLSRRYANYVAINGDPRGDEMANIHHEYLHYVIRNNYASLPLWLNEGLAEYYSTFEVSGPEAKIGLPLPHHIVWLRKNALIPLRALLAIDEQSPEYNEEEPRGSFYAQSWALVHYLLAGSPERRAQAVEYLRLLQNGSPREEAFQKTFGDPAALERELRSYIQGYVFNFSRAPVEPGTGLAVEARPMEWHDVLFRLGNLLVNMDADQEKAAAEHFRAALEARPDHGPALAGLGEIEERAGRRREAHAYYERAAQLAPDDFLIQFLYGENLLEIDPSRESREKARAALSRVVALRPDFGEAWARLGYSYNGQEILPPEAIQAMETAFRLLPSRMDVTHNLAIAYAQVGQRDKAEKLVDRMIAARAENRYIENAREALLSETHRKAEELIGQQKVEEAIPLLEEVRDKTTRADRRAEIERRIAQVREVLEFNRFVDRYNEAVRLANQGNHKGAVAVLEPLAQTTKNPDQARQAKDMLERIRALLRK